MIHALILAAGTSQRMGMPKPLLRFKDTTFLEQIIAVLQQSTVDTVTVVLGSQAEMIREHCDLSAVDVVVNRDYHAGQLSSLAAGLRVLPALTEVVVVCLVDQPFVTSTVVDQLVHAFRVTGRPIVVPVHGGRRGHPTLFAREVFDELLNIPQDRGARDVVHAQPDRVWELEVSESTILASINTPADYIAHFGSAPKVRC
jgi:molybdenum cofactor cytidylyltransferase